MFYIWDIAFYLAEIRTVRKAVCTYLESRIDLRRRGISYIKCKAGRLTALVTDWVGTTFENTLLQERYRGG